MFVNDNDAGPSLWGRSERAPGWQNGGLITGEELLEERRRRRRAGGPRLTDGDRELLRRLTTGDL
ncbi:MAG: hypothetical protein M0Z95_00605 [Actinomycetota bacterium]|nr:hypothetical protein [Actinomycetota bacterium]